MSQPETKMHWINGPTVQDGVVPDSNDHGANMGLTWGRQDPGGPHVGLMNLVIRGDMETAIISIMKPPLLVIEYGDERSYKYWIFDWLPSGSGTVKWLKIHMDPINPFVNPKSLWAYTYI